MGQWLRRPGHPGALILDGFNAAGSATGSVISLSDFSGGMNTFSSSFNKNGQSDDLLTGADHAIEVVNFAQVKYTSQNTGDVANLFSVPAGLAQPSRPALRTVRPTTN